MIKIANTKSDSDYHFALVRTFCDFQTWVETLARSFDILSHSNRVQLIIIKNELDAENFSALIRKWPKNRFLWHHPLKRSIYHPTAHAKCDQFSEVNYVEKCVFDEEKRPSSSWILKSFIKHTWILNAKRITDFKYSKKLIASEKKVICTAEKFHSNWDFIDF